MNVWTNWIERLGQQWRWVAGQFVGVLLLLMLGLAWTRLPDQHGWQVALTLAFPLLLLAALLALQAGTMRALMDDEAHRVRFVWGSLTLLVWIGVFWAVWLLLDWCNGQIPLWEGYLNSRLPAGARAQVFTFDHLTHWMTLAEWCLRWIIVPGKLIVCASASAQWGWRMPLRRITRVLLNWRWWPAVVAAGLLAAALPPHFFGTMPRGTVSHQVWTVLFKLAGAYLLAVSSWLALLAWAAVLLRSTAPAETVASTLPEGGDNAVRHS